MFANVPVAVKKHPLSIYLSGTVLKALIKKNKRKER
jgi:hypothetical protein